nr:hypothetical protein [uncultured Sediminibacterium sp.]
MKDPKKITYLLGAGASANCLPIINELPAGIDQFIKFINNTVNSSLLSYSANFSEKNAKKLITDLEWLKSQMNSHKTVDTLAKKFYLIKEKEAELIKLKKILIVYFMFEQLIHRVFIREGQDKELPDKRYDSFIATIINNKRGNLSLAPNFKVVTWNYDIQFELAYKEYQPNYKFNEIQKQLQIIPTQSYIEGNSAIDISEFSIVKLNGVAGLTSFEPFIEIPIPDSETNEIVRQNIRTNSVIVMLANKYASSLDEDIKSFNYAWEDREDFLMLHQRKNNIIDEATSIMRQTEILVIIGYSFPLFNREIDKKLINACKKTIRKVYIQDPKALEIRDLFVSSFVGFHKHEEKSTLSNPRTIPVEFVSSSLDQFLIPYELDLDSNKRTTVLPT